MEKYWTPGDAQDVELAMTFEELQEIAMRIIVRMPQPLGQICGPLSSGGHGSMALNLEAMRFQIIVLRAKRKNIFSQLPFEKQMGIIKDLPYYKGGAHLLDAFYLPIFRSGLVKTLYFMDNWRSSYGAKWEHDRAEELGIEIVYL